MTVHVGTYDAKSRLSELLELAASGEEVIITRHGKPVAKLVQPDHGLDTEKRVKAQEAARWIRENRGQNALQGETIKGLIDEGRRF